MRVTAFIFAVCSTILVLFLFLAAYLSYSSDGSLPHEISKFKNPISNKKYWKSNSGSVSTMDGQNVFTSEELEVMVPNVDMSKYGFVKYWYTGEDGAVASVLGSDRKHHFVQGYLSKYMPFETDQLWIPLYTISMRKKYEYDEAQYNGFVEIWQNSMEAYANTRGDCEDHAIILCDWLNSLGYQARVAAGLHNSTGHAWVVLYMDGKSFILEATQKSNLKNNSHYPLASILPEYKPEFMFDHDFYYVPMVAGDLNHDKSHWVKSSRLDRNVPLGERNS